MKVFLVLVLALAYISAASIPETPVALKNAKSPNVIKGRIIKGYEAYSTLLPYQVGLLQKKPRGLFWCGGSLIGKSWVLTAAHCTDGAESVIVFLGLTDFNNTKIVYKVNDTNSIIQHHLYNSTTYANDLSLIKIPNNYTYTDEIQPIRLPAFSKKPSTYSDKYATASGWGMTSDNSTSSSTLKYVSLYVIKNDECAKIYGTNKVTDKTLCVDTAHGENICHGDSGGPLVLDSELIGVASFAPTTSCQTGNPSGFVRVTSYLDWINLYTNISY